MSRRTISIHVIAILATVVVALATAENAIAQRSADEQRLIAVLKSADSPKAEKAITCKKLAVFGSAKAVPALAKLLEDEELISWSRIALEAIPGPEADQVLRDALGKLEGRSLIGVVNSIAYRQDAQAVPQLTELLESEDADVAEAAAVALGKIGGDNAVQTLEKLLADGPAAVRPAVAEALVYAAENLLESGSADQAVALYDKIRAAEVPKQRVVEATRGAILARGGDGIPLLVEQLQSDDEKLFQIGLMTARELSGEGVADAVAAELDGAPPRRAALILLALADRGDVGASPAMVKAAKTGPAATRIAAIRVLAASQQIESVPPLLAIAVDETGDVAQAAMQVLVDFPGESVDQKIVDQLAGASGDSLKVLVVLIGKRRIDATDALVKASESADPNVRSAALAALGETIAQKDISVLIDRVASPKDAGESAAAQKALLAACIRMPDGEACAAELTAAMKKASEDVKVKYLNVLGAMNNPAALAALSSAAKSGNEKLMDASTRLLGETMNLKSGPVILDLAKTLPNSKYKIRAMRGYIRLVRQFNMPDRQRVYMCLQALKAAGRSEERDMVFGVMERYPSVDMLRLAAQAAKVAPLKKDAIKVGTAIAQKLGADPKQAKELLAQMSEKPLKIEIVKAEYGAGQQWRDVTKALSERAGDTPWIPLATADFNSAFGGDPAPGVVKSLKIEYRINGKEGEVSLPENSLIILPLP